MSNPARLVQLYEASAFSRQESLLRLLQAAAERSPAEIASELPPDVIDELRGRSATAPASPDECRVFGSVCAGPGFDAEAHFRKESQRFYDGLRRWHAYFVDAQR
jgi:hypothetical protein